MEAKRKVEEVKVAEEQTKGEDLRAVESKGKEEEAKEADMKIERALELTKCVCWLFI